MYQKQPEPVDLKAMMATYLRYWYLFLLGPILGLGAAFLYLRYTTPLYEIKTSLLIKDEKNNPLASESGEFSGLSLLSPSKSLDDERIILKSQSLMQRVLTELELQTSYSVQGRVLNQEVYGDGQPIKVIINKLSPAAYDKALLIHIKDRNTFDLEEGASRTTHKFGQQINKRYGVFTIITTPNISKENYTKPIAIKFNDLEALAGAYAEKLNVEPINAKTSVLALSMIDPVPQKGVDIMAKLISVYNKEAVEDKNLIAAKTLDFIDERLKYLTSELSGVEKNVENYKRRNELANVSSQAQQYIEEASENSKKVAELEIQYDVLESIQKYLKQEDGQYQLVPSSLNIQDPTLVGLITKFNELQMERERMLRTVEPSNPVVVSLNEQLINLRNNILENLRNIKNGLAITRRSLRAKSGQFGSQIQQVPVVERQLIEITRQQEIKQALYSYLLQKREESALSLAATVSNARTIDPPTYTGPVAPKRTNIFLYSIIIGLFLPFAGIYLRNVLNNKIETLRDVEYATDTPILGEIARNKNGQPVIITEKNRTPVAEMFRLIRTNLQFFTLQKENKVILITSSMSGEGKTFFSINLATSLVSAGKKVVVVDFDLRKPSLLNDLGLAADAGVTNYLVSEATSLDDIIKPSKVMPDLFVIGAGPIPPNPGEIMMNPRVEQLLSHLKEHFDYIILDTAPVGQVADAFALAPHIDSTIYLVRYNYTRRDQLEIVNDIYHNRKLNSPMLVLNDAKPTAGYSYGYGYGYEQEVKKTSSKLA